MFHPPTLRRQRLRSSSWDAERPQATSHVHCQVCSWHCQDHQGHPGLTASKIASCSTLGHLGPPKQESWQRRTVQATTKCRGSRYRSIFSLSTSSAACGAEKCQRMVISICRCRNNQVTGISMVVFSAQNTEEVNKHSLRPGWGKMRRKCSTPPIFGGFVLQWHSWSQKKSPRGYLRIQGTRKKMMLKSLQSSFSPSKKLPCTEKCLTPFDRRKPWVFSERSSNRTSVLRSPAATLASCFQLLKTVCKTWHMIDVPASLWTVPATASPQKHREKLVKIT